MADRVQVAEAASEEEAEVIREVLELQGIAVYYQGEGELGSPDPAFDDAPRAVFVHPADEEAARRALAEAEAGG